MDWVIVGAGFTGCTLAERIASQLGETVLVIERRRHVAGNAFDYYNEHGHLVHKYGPHVFHTNSREVWEYLSQFTEWRPYYHRVVAVVQGKQVPLPFNLESLQQLFPARLANIFERRLVSEFGYGARVPVLRLLEHSDKVLRSLGQYVYERVFLGYTIKQWGLRPEELDPSVTGRVPIVVSRDCRYFQDCFQAVPSLGYTALFLRMLSHANIRVLLGADYRDVREDIHFRKGLVYTGPIDEFFDYKHGALEYRSIRFEFVTLDEPMHQKVATVNYPEDYNFTRVTEMKHITGQQARKTTLIREYPERYEPGANEPYYPVPRPENRERYNLYAEDARRLGRSVVFAGRLGDYKYYNMDQAVARALKLFRDLAKM
ncbi:UDP-galactopyranose mutase [Geochorda subterranea]|uniref:UDP-galactopyranose mutase n=1 Tax=Geochorda subterranea TaxID=3109564 RepID=A0ABZ1BMF1_9FIRM|nr:UDP-galactopyranose mutase [Limnochorda sp. LNt]WRP13731.1 UDP-galactopyranose mutase [Limnochorda sp. LNt]